MVSAREVFESKNDYKITGFELCRFKGCDKNHTVAFILNSLIPTVVNIAPLILPTP